MVAERLGVIAVEQVFVVQYFARSGVDTDRVVVVAILGGRG
jgi:hypothetical protein